MSVKHLINRNLNQIYARVKYPMPSWRFFNKKSIELFNSNKPKLNELQERIVAELREEGISTTTLDELFPGENVLETLRSYATQLEHNGSTNHKKRFLVDYWDECVELDINNPFLRYSLNPKILDVANTYMEMYCSLLYFTLQKTTPLEGELTNSQNWHRDPQEQKIVKVFIYLNDIDLDSGPFTYVKRSAPTNPHEYGKLFPQRPPDGSYPGNDLVEKAIPATDITPMTGKAGTITFCDTNGLHYGGVARKNPRIMSTFGYSAHSFRENRMYYFDQSFLDSISDLPQQSRYAIRKQWMNK